MEPPHVGCYELHGKDMRNHAFRFLADGVANPAASFPVNRRIILLLPGEKAGMREAVKPILQHRRTPAAPMMVEF
jgi:hypothetical protein